MSSKQFYPGWCEDAGRAAGLAERGGGANETITARRPSNWVIKQRQAAAERRARARENSNRTQRLARALDEGAEEP